MLHAALLEPAERFLIVYQGNNYCLWISPVHLQSPTLFDYSAVAQTVGALAQLRLLYSGKGAEVSLGIRLFYLDIRVAGSQNAATVALTLGHLPEEERKWLGTASMP